MIGGNIIQAPQYHNQLNPQGNQYQSMQKMNQYGQNINGITVIKDNNIMMSGNIPHGLIAQAN